MSGEAVECIFMEDAPEAERIWVGVTAREKMSVMCAWRGQWVFCWRGSLGCTIVDGMRRKVLLRLETINLVSSSMRNMNTIVTESFRSVRGFAVGVVFTVEEGSRNLAGLIL